MGFTINDTIVLSSGVTLTGAYVVFGKNTLRLQGVGGNKYKVQCVASVYKDKQAFKQNKTPIDTMLAEETINETHLNGNLFKRLFNILKLKFTSTTDDS